MPHTGSDQGVEQELAVVHPGQSCGDGDEVPDARNESSCQSGHHAVVVKIALALLHLLRRQEAHLAPTASGEAVDDGATEVERSHIVDAGAHAGSEGGSQPDQHHVQVAGGSMVGGGRHNKF